MLCSLIEPLLIVLVVVTQSRATPTLPSETQMQIPPPFVHAGDAIYDIHNIKLRSALTCPDGAPGRRSTPMLLIHRPGSSNEESWNKAYFPLLSAKGYSICYLDLPSKGTGDMQKSAAYVAYNLHHLSWISAGQKVLVIAHGQANSIVQWALQFYPSTQRATSTFIGLSPNFAGLEAPTTTEGCDVSKDTYETHCLPYIWQQAKNSNYYKALHYKYSVAQVPTTLLWSNTDDIIDPPEPNADLPSAISINVQSLCPDRLVNHTAMLTDAVVFKMVLDILLHGGRAVLARLLANAYKWCAMENAEEVEPVKRSVWERWLGAGPKTTQVGNVQLGGETDMLSDKVAAEPELMAYALPRNQ